ncbi:MAG: tRNA (adenosine(37)-N6)-threonylcarbamoyltransferase complex dimerization subunit type 1 TsaB [Thermoanaerobaculia bacterium]
MLVLAIDAASPMPAVALAAGQDVTEEALPLDRRASENLLPAVARVLRRCGRVLSDCERLAVCAGPGSFTGLRVGIASAWALARALSRPLESVSTLEAMAEAARAEGVVAVLAALDAGRGDASVALFDVTGARAVPLGAPSLQPLWQVRAAAPEALLVALPAGLVPGAINPAASPARALALAVARAPRREAETLSPIYARMSAAEEKKRGAAPA